MAPSMQRSRSLRSIHLAAVAALVLLVGACGSDEKAATTTTASQDTVTSTTGESVTETTGAGDTGDAGDLEAGRAAIVARSIKEAATVGYDLDVDCVTALVDKLNDEDVALLAVSAADTSPDATTPELSEDGDALGDGLLDCAKGGADPALIQQAVDKVLDDLKSEGTLDEECVQENFSNLSKEQLQAVIDSETDSTDPKLQAAVYALFDCLSTNLGGSDSSTATTDTTGPRRAVETSVVWFR